MTTRLYLETVNRHVATNRRYISRFLQQIYITALLLYLYKGTGNSTNPLKHTVHYILPRGTFRIYALSDSTYLFFLFFSQQTGE